MPNGIPTPEQQAQNEEAIQKHILKISRRFVNVAASIAKKEHEHHSTITEAAGQAFISFLIQDVADWLSGANTPNVETGTFTPQAFEAAIKQRLLMFNEQALTGANAVLNQQMLEQSQLPEGQVPN